MRYGGEYGYWRDDAARVYVRARHYAPGAGRWVIRDPVGFRGRDWNLYRYVENAAGINLDPSGLYTILFGDPSGSYMCVGDGCGPPPYPDLVLNFSDEPKFMACWFPCLLTALGLSVTAATFAPAFFNSLKYVPGGPGKVDFIVDPPTFVNNITKLAKTMCKTKNVIVTLFVLDLALAYCDVTCALAFS